MSDDPLFEDLDEELEGLPEDHIMVRLTMMEKAVHRLLQSAMENDEAREALEKRLSKRMKLRVLGTPEGARRGRVGRAARLSGFTYRDWISLYGMRETIIKDQQPLISEYKNIGSPQIYPVGMPEAEIKKIQRRKRKEREEREAAERKEDRRQTSLL
ncbi:MAG: hypothetical protein GY772_09325 [bacterium]|nr:hypothetical protein [bacterium]